MPDLSALTISDLATKQINDSTRKVAMDEKTSDGGVRVIEYSLLSQYGYYATAFFENEGLRYELILICLPADESRFLPIFDKIISSLRFF
ncbi:MAG: hypothetical protein Q8N98_00250 [bacterium]|nr:hypothetical protein [bacterium]